MSGKNMLVMAACACLAALAACGGPDKGGTLYAGSALSSPQSMLAASRTAALEAMTKADRSEKKGLAAKGVEEAERCLMVQPENPGCYYWRAVNTGLYHSVHIIDYQKGIRRMVADCDKVISIAPEYENAGAYRMLGQLYTQLPETAIHPGSVTRDLDLAEANLRKAVTLAPDYPENHLALAEALLQNGKAGEALEELALANELAPGWRKDISYEQWRTDSISLEQRISRATKD